MYIPKDEGDLEYKPSEFLLSANKNTNMNAEEWFTNATDGDG